jgi:imidazole glycerol-phosphate synthase subunit HisF
VLAKRVIACLDVLNGRVVKGRRFRALRDAGDPVALAARYCAEGIDELVVLDISATLEERLATLSVIEALANAIDVPLTVGGGVRNVDDMEQILGAGADKVSVNSAALERPELLSDGAQRFGSQCIVLAVDACCVDGREAIATHGARVVRDRDPVAWAIAGAALGAGEILLTSIERDGESGGFDCVMLARMTARLDIPVIASGGASTADSFADAFSAGADGALGASCFHFERLRIADVKDACRRRGVTVRP